MIPVMLFFGIILVWSATLFRDTANPWCATVGGMAFSLLLAQLLGGIGAQHFYPQPSALGMWAAIFLALRLTAMRSSTRASRVRSCGSGRQPEVGQQWPTRLTMS
jgi:hypothetical protein